MHYLSRIAGTGMHYLSRIATYLSGFPEALDGVYSRQRNSGGKALHKLIIVIALALLASSASALTQTKTQKLANAPTSARESVIYSFCGQPNCADGLDPLAGVIRVKESLYGTTIDGGRGLGVVYSIDLRTETESTLYSFSSGGDGSQPVSDLLYLRGVFYGVTEKGGAYGGGTVFSLDNKTGVETVLHSFGKGTDGSDPFGTLIYANKLLYGTTTLGGGGTGCGGSGCGTLFSISPTSGAEKIVHSFGYSKDGKLPSGLTEANGTLYGTTASGGTGSCSDGCGTVFSFDLKNHFEQVVYSFGSVGAQPDAALINVKGTLYGTTTSPCGSVFSFDPQTDAVIVLHSFSGGRRDGCYPVAGVINVKGVLYGTTKYGGGSGCSGQGCGTVFAVNITKREETLVYRFQDNGADGTFPLAGLTNLEKALYGTTYSGGANNAGTVFKISP